jgi:hypothetical protein
LVAFRLEAWAAMARVGAAGLTVFLRFVVAMVLSPTSHR